jgi:hypothetical protein
MHGSTLSLSGEGHGAGWRPRKPGGKLPPQVSRRCQMRDRLEQSHRGVTEQPERGLLSSFP